MSSNSDGTVIALRRGRDDATALIIRAGELLRLATEARYATVVADLERLALHCLNQADRLELGATQTA